MSRKPTNPLKKAETVLKKRKALTLPGQQRFKSFEEAMKHVSDEMGQLHLQAMMSKR